MSDAIMISTVSADTYLDYYNSSSKITRAAIVTFRILVEPATKSTKLSGNKIDLF